MVDTTRVLWLQPRDVMKVKIVGDSVADSVCLRTRVLGVVLGVEFVVRIFRRCGLVVGRNLSTSRGNRVP